MNKALRFTVLLVCVLLLAALLSSYAFLAVFAGHHCEDHHCSVCEHAALLSRMLRGALALAVFAGAAGVLNCRRPDRASYPIGDPAGLTPVALRIRLND